MTRNEITDLHRKNGAGILFDKDIQVGDVWERKEISFSEYYIILNIEKRLATLYKSTDPHFREHETIEDPYGTANCWILNTRAAKPKKSKTNRLANL